MPEITQQNLIAVLHQGRPGSALPTIDNAWHLQSDLCAALREAGWQAQAVFLDDAFSWLRQLQDLAPRLVFNAADLGFFYDMTLEPHIPAVLDAARLRYTGQTAYAAALSSDKFASKVFLASRGVPVPRCWLADQTDAPDLKFPVILKPRFGHNSYGMTADSVITSREHLTAALARLGPDAPEPVLEEYIDGLEVVAGFLGNAPRLAMPQFRIDYGVSFAGRPKILDYRAKWIEDSDEYRDSMPVPAGLPDALAAQIDAALLTAADALQVHDYGRCDFRVRTDPDGKTVAYAIDFNTNPDLSRNAGMCRMATAAGMSYAALIDAIVRSALARAPRRGVRDQSVQAA